MNKTLRRIKRHRKKSKRKNQKIKKIKGGSIFIQKKSMPGIFHLNVLDPAVANNKTLDLKNKNLPDEDVPKIIEDETLNQNSTINTTINEIKDLNNVFNTKRFEYLKTLLIDKLTDHVILLQEVSDDFVKVLFPDIILNDLPKNAPKTFTVISNKSDNSDNSDNSNNSEKKSKYDYIYFRSPIMRANVQQGLLIACKKGIMQFDTIKEGNKAFSVIINDIRYATAHFPGGPPEQINKPYNDALLHSGVLGTNEEKCIFTCDMNQHPEIFKFENFKLSNNSTEKTTCGVNYYMNGKYNYAPPDYIDAIWVKNMDPLPVTIQNLNKIENNVHKYYSDHKALHVEPK